MELVHKLENMIEGWFKPLPHMPAEGRKWLSENIWWITLIGVILAALGIFSLYNALNALNSLNNSFGGIWTVAVEQAHGGMWTTSIYISMALLAATAAIEVVAISPLKVMSKKGWDLLFLAGIVGVVSGVVQAVLNVEIPNLIFTILGAAIGAYLLFEIRPSFKSAK